MESSGQAVSKTVPGFAFWATFEGDTEGFRPLKVMVASTVCASLKISSVLHLSWEWNVTSKVGFRYNLPTPTPLKVKVFNC